MLGTLLKKEKKARTYKLFVKSKKKRKKKNYYIQNKWALVLSFLYV